MLEQSENDSAKILPPPKQLIIDWVEAANGTLDANPTIVYFQIRLAVMKTS